MQYILDENRQPKEEPDTVTWARWLTKERRHVARDEIGGVVVSTIFLGLDHRYDGCPPVLWETMIFGGEEDQYQDRYTSEEAALAGHARAVATVKSFSEPR